MAYTTLVRPQLEYASTIWSPHTDKEVDALERIQRQAARFSIGDFRRTSSVTSMLHSLSWDLLEHRRLLNQCIMFYKVINGFVDIQLPGYVVINTRPSRHTDSLSSRYIHLQTGSLSYRYTFYPRVIPVWNLLPALAINAISVETFRIAAMPIIKTMAVPPTLRRF